MESDDSVRLAKAIAGTGYASRRRSEELVETGHVSVNGKVVLHPGHPVRSGDAICIDGKPLPSTPARVYLIVNKPRGTVTRREDPEGRESVLALVDRMGVRVDPVGQLDFDTEGALLLTNDGELANRLTHPSSEVPRRYLAKVWRRPTEKTLDRIRNGLKLEDGRTKPCKARVVEQTDGDNAWVEITVHEARHRLIKRMFEAVGHPVSKLRRESFATIGLKGLERGTVRHLTHDEVERLREICRGVKPARAGKGMRRKPGHARAKPKKRR